MASTCTVLLTKYEHMVKLALKSIQTWTGLFESDILTLNQTYYSYCYLFAKFSHQHVSWPGCSSLQRVCSKSNIALVAFESRLSVHEYHNIHSEDVAKNFIVWVACGISFFHEPLHASNSVLEKEERDYLKGGVCLLCNECGYPHGCPTGISCLT